MLHGYIDPDEYEIVPHTRRYADAPGRGGLLCPPQLPQLPPSDSGPGPYRIGYATDVLNLIAIVRRQSQGPLGTLRRPTPTTSICGATAWAGVALRVITVVNTGPYLRAAVLYSSMSGDEGSQLRLHPRLGRQPTRPLQSWPRRRRRWQPSPLFNLSREEAAVAVITAMPTTWCLSNGRRSVRRAERAIRRRRDSPRPEFFYDLQPTPSAATGMRCSSSDD